MVFFNLMAVTPERGNDQKKVKGEHMLNNAQIDSNHEIQALNADATQVARLAPALGAMIFGLTIILITAFAPVQAVHNATHDTRHAFNV